MPVIMIATKDRDDRDKTLFVRARLRSDRRQPTSAFQRMSAARTRARISPVRLKIRRFPIGRNAGNQSHCGDGH